MDAAAILDRLDRAEKELHQAYREAARLARALMTASTARAADDDDWQRMPARGGRCPISGWSRSTVETHASAGTIRSKRIGGMRYYAGLDVRTYLSKPNKTEKP
jgi:hypothetical protein